MSCGRAPLPERPYTEQRVHYPKAGLDYSGKGPGWMHISDYSLGVILNWGTHILDITQWALNTERTGPVEVEGTGEFPKDNLWDVLQKFEVRYRYASGIEVIYTNAGRPFVRVEGTEGWIEHTWFKQDGFIASDEKLLSWKPGPNDVQFPLISEKQDFVNCIKSRKETMIPAEIGHRTASHVPDRLDRRQARPEAEVESCRRELRRQRRGEQVSHSSATSAVGRLRVPLANLPNQSSPDAKASVCPRSLLDCIPRGRLFQCVAMSRYDYLEPDSSLRTAFDRRNADELKMLLSLLPGAPKVGRKGEIIEALARCLLSDVVRQVWAQLKPLEQSAVAEAVHSDEGKFEAGGFRAKYGALPVFEIKEANSWRPRPTLLGLFFQPHENGGRAVPRDLRRNCGISCPNPWPQS